MEQKIQHRFLFYIQLLMVPNRRPRQNLQEFKHIFMIRTCDEWLFIFYFSLAKKKPHLFKNNFEVDSNKYIDLRRAYGGIKYVQPDYIKKLIIYSSIILFLENGSNWIRCNWTYTHKIWPNDLNLRCHGPINVYAYLCRFVHSNFFQGDKQSNHNT